jgi:hypothetical protein
MLTRLCSKDDSVSHERSDRGKERSSNLMFLARADFRPLAEDRIGFRGETLQQAAKSCKVINGERL